MTLANLRLYEKLFTELVQKLSSGSRTEYCQRKISKMAVSIGSAWLQNTSPEVSQIQFELEHLYCSPYRLMIDLYVAE